MALNWQWNDKMGETVNKDGFKTTLYKGNAYVISIYHYEENGEPYYQLNWFAVNKDHMKNMLGLSKGFDNCFKDFGVKEIRLDVNYKETAELVQMFAKAKLEINQNFNRFGGAKMRTNQGFIITHSFRYSAKMELVLGESETTFGTQYVTWECKDGNNYFWGHYFTNKRQAMIDFAIRLAGEFGTEIEVMDTEL